MNGCWMDKEWAEWLHAKSCSQWLSVQAETSREWCPSSAYTVTTLFMNNIASGFAGWPQSLRKFADGTKLTDAVDNAQGEG